MIWLKKYKNLPFDDNDHNDLLWNENHNELQLDMSNESIRYTGWLTTSRVENEWTQPGSFYGEPEIL